MKKSQVPVIQQYAPSAVFLGLQDGASYRNRLVGSCVYACPRCRHQIRFRWRSFYNADGRSAFGRKLRRVFEEMTPALAAELGFIDFFCPTCAAPTRIIFSAQNYSKITYHFDMYAALVGEGTAR